jgi:hypothetical protein
MGEVKQSARVNERKIHSLLHKMRKIVINREMKGKCTHQYIPMGEVPQHVVHLQSHLGGGGGGGGGAVQ